MLSKKLAAVDKTRCVACGVMSKYLSDGGCQGAPWLLRRRGGRTLRRLWQVRKALSRRLH